MDQRIELVIRLMKNDHRRALPLRTMAKSLNLSATRLCCLFKAETGMPPARYLRTLRMDEAATLLSTTFLSVTTGKVLLVFLTTDCDACKKEVSNISQAIPSLAAKVKIFGVCIEDRESVIPFAEETHVDFPILLDYRARILTRLGVRFMPTKVLLHDGIITKYWYGSSPDKAGLIRDVGEVEKK